MGAEERRQYKEFADVLKRTDKELSGIASSRNVLTNDVKTAYRNLQISLAVDILKEI